MFEHIFHPSDFSETSQVAFVHALRIAEAAKAELQLLHVSAMSEPIDFDEFPGIREVLERWQILEKGSSRRDVIRLGMNVDKTIIHDNHPVAAIAEFLNEEPSSLVVLAAHEDTNSLLAGHSKAEPIARKAATTTLFVPAGVPGFVSMETGAINLRNIVIPVALEPEVMPTIESIRELVKTLAVESCTIHFLHVGTQATLPELPHQVDGGIDVQVHVMDGDAVPAIIGKSQELHADLIAMTTAGRHGFLDALRGSTTERVLRAIKCPLWAVTAN